MAGWIAALLRAHAATCCLLGSSSCPSLEWDLREPECRPIVPDVRGDERCRRVFAISNVDQWPGLTRSFV
jgi:hypothetical protein